MKSIAFGFAVFLAVATIQSLGYGQTTPGLSIQTSRTDCYSPDSPWSNGRVFKSWIGHGGWFYNCDCEEEKRFSPYIRWKSVTHCESHRLGLSGLRSDIQEVQARVRAGKCENACWPTNPCPDCCVAGSCSGSNCDQPGTRPLPVYQAVRNSDGQQFRNSMLNMEPPVPKVESRVSGSATIVKPAANSGTPATTGILSVRPSTNLKR